MHGIKDTRRVLGVTQAELAELLGLNQSTVSRLERGTLQIDARTRLALEALVARQAPAEQQVTA
jgi:transcriptional regulator with XRE-family HTH domain